MINKRYKILILFLFILFGFIVNSMVLSKNEFQTLNYKNYDNKKLINPKISTTHLKYSDIHKNATRIYRLFESINFTIDTSTNFPSANYTIMEIQFSNSTVRNYNMVPIIGTGNFTYEFKPKYNTQLGFHRVSFLIYNDTHNLLNNHTTYTNFTIETNCMANFFLEGLLNSEYYINDTLEAELIVNNFTSDDGNTYEFQWDLTIVDSKDEVTQNILLNLNSNVNHFTLLIDNETFQEVNKIYYLKINMTDIYNRKKATAYFPFHIKNSNPIITSEIDISPDEIFRTEVFSVSVNVTDLETRADALTVKAEVQDSEGQYLPNKILGHEGDNLFKIEFTIPANRPIGRYSIIVTATDEDNGIDTKTAYLDVKNNFPEIYSYRVNDLSMNQSISVFYGKNLVFSFNVSDKEGISLIKVALLNENDEWFNITREYKGEDTKITIRTQDLISGIWIVYIYVIDTDGAITSLTDDYDMAPQGIRIVPDVLSSYIPWIVFIAGLSIGTLLGIGIIHTYNKSKFIGKKPETAEKKKKAFKKPIKKKKLKTKKVEEKSKQEEIEDMKFGEEEEEEGLVKRKIKRKL